MTNSQAESSSDVGQAPRDLPREDQVILISSGGPQTPGGSTRLQRLYVSLVAASYFSVHSTLEGPVRASVEAVENTTSIVSNIFSYRAMLRVLNSQPMEGLQDGMTVGLGTDLVRCVKGVGNAALVDLAMIALKGEANPEVLSHALRWVGRMADPESTQQRLLVLTRVLRAPSSVVRDGAALGLVELGSPSALPALDAAIDQETNAALREDLEQAARYLRTNS